jgi:hypothetical protein
VTERLKPRFSPKPQRAASENILAPSPLTPPRSPVRHRLRISQHAFIMHSSRTRNTSYHIVMLML